MSSDRAEKYLAQINECIGAPEELHFYLNSENDKYVEMLGCNDHVLVRVDRERGGSRRGLVSVEVAADGESCPETNSLVAGADWESPSLAWGARWMIRDAVLDFID